MIERPRKLVAGAGLEPAHWRLMRPLPYLLATPHFEKWHGVSVLPRAGEVLETKLHKLAPAVLFAFENWCGQPELHRHRLIGTQASCSWTMTANGRRGLRTVRTRAAYDKKEQTPLPPGFRY